MEQQFTILGEIHDIQTIATGKSIRILKRLNRFYGEGRWRKLKGIATIQLVDGTICKAEVHWYEMHGVGKKEIKLKRIISQREL